MLQRFVSVRAESDSALTNKAAQRKSDSALTYTVSYTDGVDIEYNRRALGCTLPPVWLVLVSSSIMST